MEEIKKLIYMGQADEAIARLNALIEENPASDEAFYLRGNAYRKKGDIQQSLNNYLKAMELNPDSPARRAHDMMMRILDFSDPNRFNQ